MFDSETDDIAEEQAEDDELYEAEQRAQRIEKYRIEAEERTAEIERISRARYRHDALFILALVTLSFTGLVHGPAGIILGVIIGVVASYSSGISLPAITPLLTRHVIFI